MPDSNRIGSIGWADLTVEDAESIRDFYSEVVGWTFESVDMGGYSDFTMCLPATGEAVAGVCHALGPNAKLPPVWLVYVNVDNVEASIEQCRSLGGSVISGPHRMGDHGRYCIVRDPAGAPIGLFEPASQIEEPKK